jgi:hypothetical protein
MEMAARGQATALPLRPDAGRFELRRQQALAGRPGDRCRDLADLLHRPVGREARFVNIAAVAA